MPSPAVPDGVSTTALAGFRPMGRRSCPDERKRDRRRRHQHVCEHERRRRECPGDTDFDVSVLINLSVPRVQLLTLTFASCRRTRAATHSRRVHAERLLDLDDLRVDDQRTDNFAFDTSHNVVSINSTGSAG